MDKIDNFPKNKRVRKKFEELTITDDFMFGAVMSDPKRCKALLEKILNIKIAVIKYPEKQKSLDHKYDSKSVRLDIYAEDENNTVYNIEMQTSTDGTLSLRIRYYHDMIDLNLIEKGEPYSALKNSFVIFICTYDPFGKGRYIYTFRTQCQEDQTVFLNDCAVSVVLNCRGTVGDIDEDLKDLLHYMAGSEPQRDFAKDIADCVKEIRRNEKWRSDYMKYDLTLMRERAEGRAEGRMEGDMIRVIASVRSNKDTVSDDLLCTILGIDIELYNAISEMIDNNPDWTDEDIAEDILGYGE